MEKKARLVVTCEVHYLWQRERDRESARARERERARDRNGENESRGILSIV